MFESYVYEQSAAQYVNRILLIDSDHLEDATGFSRCFASHGFQIVTYESELSFRISHFEEIKTGNAKYAVIAKPGVYIPYDVYKAFAVFDVSFSTLFPKLNASVLKNSTALNLDLLCAAYKNCFSDLHISALTEQFLQEKVYTEENAREYLSAAVKKLKSVCAAAFSYRDWIEVSKLKATIDVLATQYGIAIDTDCVQEPFKNFINGNFGKLSSGINAETPILVSRAMEYIRSLSDKFVIVVMDGMSQFDWEVMSRSFNELVYARSAAFAMIPTTTSISRQCLLSGKYPSQLLEPWKQSKEKAEFFNCAKGLGYADEQIAYCRGYEPVFSSFVRCGAIIINDIDDLVHRQTQERIGMYNDVQIMAKQGKLPKLVKELLNQGFDVYITADHGNVPCVGVGKLMKTGVEVETKSRRMVVLKDYADKADMLARYRLIDYNKFYLNKDYDYLICDAGVSFDAAGDHVMSHGGITLDEVIVPFIRIKAEENNG